MMIRAMTEQHVKYRKEQADKHVRGLPMSERKKHLKARLKNVKDE